MAYSTYSVLDSSLGSDSITLPYGAQLISAIAWAGGGAGGATSSTSAMAGGGGGGCSVGTSLSTYDTKLWNATIDYYVGRGGEQTVSTQTVALDSDVELTLPSGTSNPIALCEALHGTNCDNSGSTAGEGGGTSAIGTNYYGGNGGLPFKGNSGGGGGGGGSDAVGGNAAYNVGGTGGAGSGGAGAPGISSAANGEQGYTFGGAGSGAISNGYTFYDGGDGASGAVYIEYKYPLNAMLFVSEMILGDTATTTTQPA